MSNQFYQENNNEDLFCFNNISLREALLAELQSLRSIINYDIFKDENYINLSDEEKDLFGKFLEFFSVCPVCKKRNHKNYLKDVYFDKNPDKMILKDRLLKLMRESKEFNDKYSNNISVGIPCCECFKKFFCQF